MYIQESNHPPHPLEPLYMPTVPNAPTTASQTSVRSNPAPASRRKRKGGPVRKGTLVSTTSTSPASSITHPLTPNPTPSPTTNPLLHDSTEAFVRRLKTRGYPVSLPLRDRLMDVLREAQQHSASVPTMLTDHSSGTTPTTHTPSFWLDLDAQTVRNLHQHVICDHTLHVTTYCALLCPMHTFKLNYINLAVVLHGLTVQDIRNVYRYCYLEWVSVDACDTLADVWKHTPRAFGKLSVTSLRVEWAEVLRKLVGEGGEGDTAQRYVRTMFFVNRLYSYLTPCGRNRINFYYSEDAMIQTTVGQLNFFRWAIENHVLDYVRTHLQDIEKAMRSFVRVQRDEKRDGMVGGGGSESDTPRKCQHKTLRRQGSQGSQESQGKSAPGGYGKGGGSGVGDGKSGCGATVHQHDAPNGLVQVNLFRCPERIHPMRIHPHPSRRLVGVSRRRWGRWGAAY